ncbi:3-methyl-2-oxobutanoate dehydrogenase subunit beta [Saccharolobus solfataricus]|uniref:2-oxoacid oxidoreductase (ferredoxin) n=2 Tax=Saccharolobus solfataricus TaxID=2287 RepID=A0A0E3ME18_SACSO|nr:3-methyl-2-oxobutanoate dehydrogenase subunit beta [Saccharolobus solfataricus]AKA75115.1 3-methyl-2-oxobutanoate dehydrogenase subunit beta [Saccharolobus solfataricus]AKA77809.1 3-methyl-2-oxobutanoate dehydrogenase subunit beta [Saccharolobus solfataricus]AKA80503.1 3-methyl-2-oxobutanoate dehydrogenase subunit beta [Saccharolobus solfataricus]AZF68867.1 3-methyl-2-oxobutanoate dehydrogenase subunit beta [Saccharolobus solfataricus]AZF71487.1 3-methyl-2-oxobutanoate dehydrogenase subunit
MSSQVTPKRMPKFYRGNAACPGCPIPKELDVALEVLGNKTVLVVPASCTTIIMGDTNGMPSTVPVVHSAFGAAAAIGSGIVRSLRMRGDNDAIVAVWAGDGSTGDIGFAAVSGAAERNEDILYICYDNEAYMNTGIQRSGLTPKGAWTTTTPEGKREVKKPLPFIIAEHKVPYVATASIAYIYDYEAKMRKAKQIRGFRYIHLLSPCPPGWRFDSKLTIDIAKLAVETGVWPLFEIENGEFKLTSVSKTLVEKKNRKPVAEYLKLQGRFKQLTEEQIKGIQEEIDEMWEEIKRLIKK